MLLAKAAKTTGRRTPAPSSAIQSRAVTPRSATPSAQAAESLVDENESSPSSDEMRRHIRRLGAHFHLFYMFYVTSAAFTYRKPSFAYDDLARIGRNPNEALAAELYDCLPNTLHPFVSTVRKFRTEVRCPQVNCCTDVQCAEKTYLSII